MLPALADLDLILEVALVFLDFVEEGLDARLLANEASLPGRWRSITLEIIFFFSAFLCHTFTLLTLDTVEEVVVFA